MSRVIVNMTDIPSPPWLEESSYADSLESMLRDAIIKKFGQIPDDVEVGFFLHETELVRMVGCTMCLNPCSVASRGKLPGKQWKKRYNLNLARKQIVELLQKEMGW